MEPLILTFLSACDVSACLLSARKRSYISTVFTLHVCARVTFATRDSLCTLGVQNHCWFYRRLFPSLILNEASIFEQALVCSLVVVVVVVPAAHASNESVTFLLSLRRRVLIVHPVVALVTAMVLSS